MNIGDCLLVTCQKKEKKRLSIYRQNIYQPPFFTRVGLYNMKKPTENYVIKQKNP